MRLVLIPLVAALGLSGCISLAPSGEAPQPPLRDSFRPTADATLNAAAAAHPWDGFFGDARLREVVGLALVGNRNLQASAAAVDRVRAQYRIAASDLLPDLDASASASRQRAAGVTSSSYSVGLSMPRWEIDLFDRLGNLKDAALSRYLAQQETQQAAQLSLVAETANAWLLLAAEQQRALLADQLQASQRRTAELTGKQYELGAASGLQRARAQAAFEAARGEAARSRAAVVQARLALELLAGQPLPDRLLPTAQADAAQTALPEVPAGLPATVLLQRPDVRAAEQQLRAAAFDVGAARAARFPRISLTASSGTRSSELGDLFSSGTGFWSLLPQLDLPIFDAGARAAQVDVSEATRRQQIASYEAVLQTAFREVADLLAVRDSLGERLTAGQAQVQAAQDALDRADAAYRLGGASQLELLDAQRQLATAQQALVSLRQTEQGNRVSLLRALGGRWAS
jgi:NodT family efflux transporter outer membrane factor (OMF) lipoprotein